MSKHDVRHIAELIYKYKFGELTPEENWTLQAWVADHEATFNELIDDPRILEELRQDHVSSHRILEIVKGRIEANERPSIPAKPQTAAVHTMPTGRPRVFRLIASIAAGLLVISLATIYLIVHPFKHSESGKHIAVSKVDWAPAGNRAILTLANGSSIILDTLTNGIIATTDGSTVRKSAPGRLVYEGASTGRNSDEEYNTLSVPRGGQYFLQLSDGSKVWLNAASTLTYSTKFGVHGRKVRLTGEAYFEVSHAGANRPFIVEVSKAVGQEYSKEAQIEVLGTHFNVSSYADESAITTTLLEGKIKVSSSSKEITVGPGQQVQLSGSNLSLIPDADTASAMAWKNGEFRFRRATIDQVMVQLSRWYNVDVTYVGPKPSQRLTAVVSRQLPASSVLKALELSGYHFRILGENNKIEVMP